MKVVDPLLDQIRSTVVKILIFSVARHYRNTDKK